MKGSVATVPEPTTMSSAILFHCATVLPGGSAADASRVVPADAAANATAAIAATRRTCVLLRFMDLHPLWWRGFRSTCICFAFALLSRHEISLRALPFSVSGPLLPVEWRLSRDREPWAFQFRYRSADGCAS